MTAATGAPRAVAITGAGLTTPLGADPAAHFARCLAGDAGFGRISLYETAGSRYQWAGEHAAPLGKDLPDRKFTKVLNRRDQTSVITAAAALRDAGPLGLSPERIGMVVGISGSHLGDLAPYLPLVASCADLSSAYFDSGRFGAELMATFNPLIVLKLLMNNALCYGTIGLSIKGVNSSYMELEVAGLRAVGEAYLAIREGRAEAAVAGGASGQVEAFQMLEAHHAGLLVDQARPGFQASSGVRPYDRDRAGTILSEGAAFVVLEAEERARARGARILGVIDGFSLATDGAPDAEAGDQPSAGIVRALAGALRTAGVGAAELGAVFGDGNGTHIHDRREALAYRQVFGPQLAGLPLVSIKGAVGELGEPGAVVALITALGALAAGQAPPTRNFAAAEPQCSDLRVRSVPQPIARHQPIAVVCRSRLGAAAALIVRAPASAGNQR